MEAQRGNPIPGKHSKSEATPGLELNSPWFFLAKRLSIPGRLVLENKLKSGQAWLTSTYIYFLLVMADPTVHALLIPGSADCCPRSLPTESRSGHRAATAGLVTPGCILWEELGHSEEASELAPCSDMPRRRQGPACPRAVSAHTHSGVFSAQLLSLSPSQKGGKGRD